MLERFFPRAGRNPVPAVPVVLYTKRGCHLCEVMKADLAAFGRNGPAYTMTEVDIEGDPELEAEHGMSIPVLTIGGRKAFKGRMDPDQLPRKFERLAGEWRRAQTDSSH